jgi:hypothetical protein
MVIRVKDVGDARQNIKQSRNQGMEAEVDLYLKSNAAAVTAQASGRKFKTTSGGLRQNRSTLERFLKGQVLVEQISSCNGMLTDGGPHPPIPAQWYRSASRL